jgi:tRNA threonylcarbamoyladenosine biosynthesis protein TsaE
MVLRSSSAEETFRIGCILGGLLAADDVLLLCGDLGAGKTHLTQGIAAGLGISEQVTSPTFNLELVYEKGRLTLYHFDLYRLEEEEQLEQIDFFGESDAGGVTVVEWGNRFASVEQAATASIELALVSEEERELRLRALDARGVELLEALRVQLVLEKAHDYVAD